METPDLSTTGPSSPNLQTSEEWFSILRDVLTRLEPGLEPVPEISDDRTRAAVAVILRQNKEREILLIKRAEAEGDPWSGQMALPGGRCEVSDKSLLQTAMRETREEVSVRLEGEKTHLGRLAPTIPNTVRLPPTIIFPFVFGVPSGTEAVVSSREVDEVLWVPLCLLQNPETAGTVEIRYPDSSRRDFPCWRVGNRVVWGLTYRILTGFIQLL